MSEVLGFINPQGKGFQRQPRPLQRPASNPHGSVEGFGTATAMLQEQSALSQRYKESSRGGGGVKPEQQFNSQAQYSQQVKLPQHQSSLYQQEFPSGQGSGVVNHTGRGGQVDRWSNQKTAQPNRPQSSVVVPKPPVQIKQRQPSENNKITIIQSQSSIVEPKAIPSPQEGKPQTQSTSQGKLEEKTFQLEWELNNCQTSIEKLVMELTALRNITELLEHKVIEQLDHQHRNLNNDLQGVVNRSLSIYAKTAVSCPFYKSIPQTLDAFNNDALGVIDADERIVVFHPMEAALGGVWIGRLSVNPSDGSVDQSYVPVQCPRLLYTKKAESEADLQLEDGEDIDVIVDFSL
jgi:hypothetical protein